MYLSLPIDNCTSAIGHTGEGGTSPLCTVTHLMDLLGEFDIHTARKMQVREAKQQIM